MGAMKIRIDVDDTRLAAPAVSGPSGAVKEQSSSNTSASVDRNGAASLTAVNAESVQWRRVPVSIMNHRRRLDCSWTHFVPGEDARILPDR
jgi:hypothetical protein